MGSAKRLASFLTAAVVTFGCVSVGFTVDADALEIQYARSQTQNQSHMYVKDYTLSGNYADDVVAVAKAQLGRTQTQFQYYEDWCADFANDCARLTEMPDTIVPYNYGLRASCGFMYKYMIENCNAKVIEDVNDVRTGDYVFYYCPSSNFYLHVGIVESPEYYIEGNYSEKVQELPFNYNFQCYMHGGYGNNSLAGHVKRIYVRPDYPEPPKKGYTYTDPDKYSDSIPSRTLVYKEGAATSGFDVCWTQAVLYKLGYLKSVTGEYNKDTVSAVKKFQSDRKLSASGEVDENTLAALKKAYEDLRTPYYSNFKSSKSVYNYGETVTLSANIRNADSYRIVVRNSGGEIIRAFDNVSSCSFPASDIGTGAYTAYLSLANSYKSFDSKSIGFSVDNPVPTAAKLAVKSGAAYNATEFSWDKTENTVSYDLYIKDSNGLNYIVRNNLTDNKFSALLPRGRYTAYVVSKNNYKSTAGDTVRFNVNSGSPVDLGDKFYARLTLSGDKFALGDSINGSLLQHVNGGIGQSWYFVRNENNEYTIKNCSRGKVLTYNSSNTVSLEDDKNSSNQKWYIAQGSDSCFFIPVNNTDRVVYSSNNIIITRKSSDGAEEAFKLTKISAVHNYEIAEITAPNCTEDGHVHYHCIVCGENISRTLSAEGHKYDEKKLGKGYSVFTCEYCGDRYEIGKPEQTDSPKQPDVVEFETPDTPDTPDTPSKESADRDIDVPKNINTYSAVIGDIDGDGFVTASDVLMINRASVGLENLTDLGKVIADVDGDGKITSADSLYVLREIVHLFTESKTGDVIYIRSELDGIKLLKDDSDDKNKLKK